MLTRPETSRDVDAIRTVVAAAFLDAPHAGHAEQFIVDALRAAGRLTVSLVADEAGAVVGHAAVSPVTISDGATGWFGLGPVAVLPAWQHRGVGVQLARGALAELRTHGASGCVVLGDPQYYSRFGFRPEPSLILPGVPPEYFQALSFDGTLPTGTVAYHDAFSVQAR